MPHLQRYFRHREREHAVVFVRCSTLAFGGEREATADKPVDSALPPVRKVEQNLRFRPWGGNGGTWRVLYSMHSSYTELVAFHDAIRATSPDARFFHALPGQAKHGRRIDEQGGRRSPIPSCCGLV